MFHGRERELELLESRYGSGRFEFVPIWGRRRVGKTTLIKRFIEGKESVYISAVRGSTDTNLSMLTERVFGLEGVKVPLDRILEEVGRRSRDRRLVLVIDEYPNLVRDAAWVSDMLQAFIDDVHESSQLFLILCGSSMNMMEREVLGVKSPLYGRRTGSLKVEPFTYFQSRAFLEGFTEDEMVRIYGMVGGIPLYLSRFDPGRSLRDNIRDNFLREDSFFLSEPTMMLLAEFGNPYTCHMVLKAVASGCTKNSEIANTIGMEASNTSALVNDLCGLGLLSKVRPADNPNGKTVRYRIGDSFLDFFYRDIYGRYDSLTPGEMEDAAGKVLDRQQDAVGRTFETICAQFLRGRGTIGTWWGSDPASRTREEIDIVVTRMTDAGPERTFCECKYTGSKVGEDVLQLLRRRSTLVKGTAASRYILFSRAGFLDGVDRHPDVETYTLEDMVALTEAKMSSGGEA